MRKGWSPKAQKGLSREQTRWEGWWCCTLLSETPKRPFWRRWAFVEPPPPTERAESGKWSQCLPSPRGHRTWCRVSEGRFESTEWGIGRSGLSHPACCRALERPTDWEAKEQGVMRVRRRAFAESSGETRSRAARLEVREGDMSSNSRNQTMGARERFLPISLSELPTYPSPL